MFIVQKSLPHWIFVFIFTPLFNGIILRGELFYVHCSLFTSYCLLHTAPFIVHCRLPTADCGLPTVLLYFYIFQFISEFLFYCSLLKFTVYCLPFTVYRLPFTVYRLPCFCTFFIVRLYPHTYNTYIIYLFVFAPPFFYCFGKDLFLFIHCSVLDRKQQVFELFVRKFLVFIAAKLVGITI